MKSYRSFAVVFAIASGSVHGQPGMSRSELAEKYPNIIEGSDAPENKKIICPFHRLLARAGVYTPEAENTDEVKVWIAKVTAKAAEFGCSKVACGGVATLASAGQLLSGTTSLGKVNLTSLHTAKGIAHDCGLAFGKGSTEVDDEVRSETIDRLRNLADNEGKLHFDDLQSVKLGICQEQGVTITDAGELEIKLIYNFLGGKERGYITVDDVERFFHAELPETIGAPGGNPKMRNPSKTPFTEVA